MAVTPDAKRFSKAMKHQFPSFRSYFHPSVQNRSTLQLIYPLGLEPPPSPYAALSIVYQLALPPDIAGQLIDREMHALEQWLVEVGDPFALTPLVHYRLARIARAAGLPAGHPFPRPPPLADHP